MCLCVLWVCCRLKVLCDSVFPIAFLALRKDLSRNHHVAKHLNSSFIIGPAMQRTKFFAYASPGIRDAALTYQGNAFLFPSLGPTRLCHLFLCARHSARKCKQSNAALKSERCAWEEEGFSTRAEKRQTRK